MAVDFDITLGLEGTHIVVTGAAGQIGQVVVQAFLSAGANISAFDINSSRMDLKHDHLHWYVVDVTDEAALESAFQQAHLTTGTISVCCALAGLDLSFIPHHKSICDMPVEQWKRTIDVNTTGTFLTARAWLRAVRDHALGSTRNVSLIIMGSEAGVFGVPGNADYATSKSAIQYGLIRSLAPEAAMIFRRARVNAVAPGPVDTPQFRKECAEDVDARYRESEATVALGQSVPMQAIARTCLMLASENFSSSITGQVVQVDGGKSGRVLWLSDGRQGW